LGTLLVAAALTMGLGLLIAALLMNGTLRIVHYYTKARRMIRASLSRKSRSSLMGRSGGVGQRPQDMTIINRVLNRIIPKSRA
jgi:hypothetical protein